MRVKNKDKNQVINNVKNVNLDIDYDKLAEAIMKVQNKTKEKKKSSWNLRVRAMGF